MSRNDETPGEPVESVGDEEAEVMIADPDDYHQSQRLREIHKARRKVHDCFTGMDTYTVENEHNRQQGQLAHAVVAYVMELLPIFRQTGTDLSLPDKLPWDTFSDFTTVGGHNPIRDEYAIYQESMIVFETANQRFAEVKPLVQPDEDDEWEIQT